MQLNMCAIIGQGKNINIYNMFLIHVRGENMYINISNIF